MLSLRSARGLVSFRIQPAAPGPLLINSLSEGGGQLEGFWLERPGGYHVELSLPLSSALVDLSIGAVDAEIIANRRVVAREAGTLDAGLPATWLSLAAELVELKSWLSSVIPRGSRAWVIDTAEPMTAAASIVIALRKVWPSDSTKPRPRIQTTAVTAALQNIVGPVPWLLFLYA